MSARDERGALTPSAALYDYARQRTRESADGLPPSRGYALPRKAAPGGEPLSWDAAKPALREALTPLPDDPVTLLRRFERLGVRDRHQHLVAPVVAGLPLPDERADAARALGRRLIREGTTAATVIAGIALLGRVGGPEDVPYLRVLGLLQGLTGPAVGALEALDPRTAAVVWLAVHARRDGLEPLVRALWAGDRPAVRRELVSAPSPVGGDVARRIAEATRLADLLDHSRDTDLLARAGTLLVRMGSSPDGPADLLGYRDAPRAYATVVGRAAQLPPTLDHAAMLLSLALDLGSGTGVLLDWPPGRRAALLASLGALLAEPRWVAAGAGADGRRADWIRRTGRRPFRPRPAAFRIEVVAGDPADKAPVETRVLIDGRPVVPAAFARGPAAQPDDLLDGGGLRAGPEPREVRLATASCAEGCCGALYVTIRRDGDQVVWENWRQTMPGSRGAVPELPAHRFDARAYDAEVARAEGDCSWSWRARTVARLIKAGLIGRPDLLSRWDASRGWISSDFDDPDTAVVTFSYAPGPPAPGRPERDGIPLQFRWDIPDDGSPPEAQAAAALRRLAEEDPKSYGRVCGGSRERAEELGYPWPYGG
ncbi:hypothetical protein [Kitasatospora brasiliensis]|uniref:hypothetical protein n=1 Tax=Kitasatospora brasiliensis TaxID=3058040 RepID=UPI00292D1A9D|nr:hypothetical protein [Kitasatospora sp. K002]